MSSSRRIELSLEAGQPAQHPGLESHSGASQLGMIQTFSFDEGRMKSAIHEFLCAAGLDPSDPQLLDTPARVLQAWRDEFLCGYGMSPSDILAERFPDTSTGPVMVTGLQFVSVCPHHLLPYQGVAHIAYLPKGEVVGLSRLSKLLDCLGRRLILQEGLTQAVTQQLMEHLKTAGAACWIQAKHGCVGLRGARQGHAQAVTVSYQGAFEHDESLRLFFLRALPSSEPPSC